MTQARHVVRQEGRMETKNKTARHSQRHKRTPQYSRDRVPDRAKRRKDRAEDRHDSTAQGDKARVHLSSYFSNLFHGLENVVSRSNIEYFHCNCFMQTSV